MVFRSGRNWKSKMGVCAVAFALTGIVVYMVGVASTHRPETTCTARAAVYYRAPSADAARGASKPAAADPHAIGQQITADANLRWALNQSALDAGAAPGAADSPPSSEALARARQNLRVTVGNTVKPGQLELSIAFTGPDAREAASLVDHLAERYAQQQRTGAKAAAQEAYTKARDAAEQARRQWLEAKAQRDAFLQHHFQQLGAEAKTLEAWSAPRASTESPPEASRFVPALPVPVRPSRPSPKPVDNPERLDLNRQVEELKRQRSELLAERTPLHPSVRKIDSQIADLQRHLGSMPSEIGEHGSDLPPVMPAPPDQTIIPPLPPTEAQLDEPPVERAPVGTRHTPTTTHPPADGRLSEPAVPGADEPDVSLPPPETTVKQRLAAMRGFSEHNEALGRAWQHYEELAGAERRAWQKQFRVPQIDLKLAGQCEIARASEHASRLPLVALVAGLAAAASIGIISLGGGGDRPFASTAEVQASLPVPVIGTIAGTRARDRSCRP